MTRHMFAGTITPNGFVHFFKQIMPLERARARYFLKGSSGSGKSTFIKKIAALLDANNFNVDLFHCANDIDSLDALSVDSLGLCMIDSTAPHPLDPEIHIAIDKVIDFAEFIDKQKISPFADEIKDLLLKKEALSGEILGYLSIAGKIYSVNNSAKSRTVSVPLLENALRAELAKFDKIDPGVMFGIDKKYFLSVITPNGFVNFAEDFFDDCKIYGIRREIADADIFLSKLRDTAIVHGINTESFYCPFDTNKIEYLRLVDTKEVFVITGKKYEYTGRLDEEIKLPQHMPIDELDVKMFDDSLNRAIHLMKKSKDLHDKIEEIYVNTINYKKLDNMTEKFLEDIYVNYIKNRD